MCILYTLELSTTLQSTVNTFASRLYTENCIVYAAVAVRRGCRVAAAAAAAALVSLEILF